MILDNPDDCLEDGAFNDKIERFLKSNKKNPSGNNHNNFNFDYDNIVTEFYRIPPLIDLKIAKRTGTEKLSNSLIGEECNQITDQAITKGVKLNGH